MHIPRPFPLAVGLALAMLTSLAALAAPATRAEVASSQKAVGRRQSVKGAAVRSNPQSAIRNPQSPVSYNRDIRPILAENCFACHGFDKNKRVANLRLDVREQALARGVIVPGKPEKSALIRRVFAADAARRMPPPAAHKTLTPAQKGTLRRWVAEGARYETHWAWLPLPARVPVPKVAEPTWCRSEIDRFVLARLEREHLKPSPAADRAVWLRRVTLDLTGVPPSLVEVDAFLADHTPQAYEKVVDRLLASPRYGERMATPWLDVARYADSYGYQSDQISPTWPYRDWVVRAFNDNLPYDRFVTWQIAGDLLPNASREQRLATAFNRLHRMTNEGGSVPEEWRLEGVADRIQTLSTAVMGLTMECARCHDHKYDPITQRDYYAFSAFFNNIDEYGLYDRADIVPSPSLLLPTPEQEKQETAAREAVGRAEEALTRTRQQQETAFLAWLAQPGHSPKMPDRTGEFDLDRAAGSKLPNLVPGGPAGELADGAALVERGTGKAAALDGESSVRFPPLGRFTRETPFTIAFRMRDALPAGETRAEPCVLFQACDGTDTGPHGYDLLLEKGRLTARIFRHWPGNAIGVRSREAIPLRDWSHVGVTYDGSSRAAGLRIYVNGRPVQTEVLRDHLYKGTGQHTLAFGQRFRDKGFRGGQIDEVSVFSRALSPIEAAQLGDGHSLQDALTEPQRHTAELRDYFLCAISDDARQAARALDAARHAVVAAEDGQREIAVMEEMPSPRPTYLLARGQYDAPRSEANRVERSTPSFLPARPARARADRLGLAGWLTRPDHPLTARVEVNRVWALLLGKGIIETQENFGTQGKLPSHPALLDWLARDFVNSGWSVKGLVRKIVLSSTYRQSSALRPDLKARDPENLLLARGPSHRLSAEAVRDTALAASGLLNDRLGGPPVSPYQPGDLWTEANSMSPAYRQSVGSDLYRRSLYTVWKRTAPIPNMIVFDAPSREVCTARRSRTGTPLQALVLLNDPQFVEAARVLGERMLKESGPTPGERVRYAFRILATRQPTPKEIQLLTELFEHERQVFANDPEVAAKLLKIGQHPADPSLPPAEVAAAAVLAQTILNLDACVWKR
jgi:hypothetical protein